MSTIYIGDRLVCDKCKYVAKPNNNISGLYCDYLHRAGHSRIFENGQKVLRAGYCDKFEEREQNRKWVDLEYGQQKN